MYAFIFLHLACLAAFWTGITTTSLMLFVFLYVLRAWGATAGYHRYFSHRSFKTGRFFQFILAFIAQSSTQKSVLWWANHHRHHHKYSDTPLDIHSPRQHGFWYAHVAWIFDPKHNTRKYTMIADFEKYPELRLLDRFESFPAVVMAIIVWWFAGWSGLVVGFVWSTVLLYHTTFTINSLSHVFGKQRYYTGDDSRNNPILAFLTLGEGWHNNHHHYPSSVRQGFYWWEYDVTFYILKLLSYVGVVYDLHLPPNHAYETEAITTHNKKQLGQFITSQQLSLGGFLKKWEAVTHCVDTSELVAGLQDCRIYIHEHMQKINSLPLRARKSIKDKLQEADRALAHAQQVVHDSKQYQQAKESVESILRLLSDSTHPFFALFK